MMHHVQFAPHVASPSISLFDEYGIYPRQWLILNDFQHHCRICGFIFCASCSSRQLPGPENSYPNQVAVRACLTCFAYYHAAKIARSKSTASLPLQTYSEWLLSDAASIESNLNPAMKMLIDSMDTYGSHNSHRLMPQGAASSRLPSSSKASLGDFYYGHLCHVVKQLLIRHGLPYRVWLNIIVEFARNAAWLLQPRSLDSTISEMVHVRLISLDFSINDIVKDRRSGVRCPKR